MAQAAGITWVAVAVTGGAAVIMLTTRLNPLWLLAVGGVLGGFGEFMRVPTSVAIKLPSTLSLTDGALIEPLAVGLHGVRLSHLQPGDRVLVLGAGTVALCAIYWAKRLGAGRIAAASRSPRRAAMALAMGADAFVQYGDNEKGEVAEALGGRSCTAERISTRLIESTPRSVSSRMSRSSISGG